MSELKFELSFPGSTLADANELCAEVLERLGIEVPDCAVSRVRSNERNQDFGAILAIVLGSAAVKALVTEISKFAMRRYGTSLEMQRVDSKGKERRIVVKGPVGDDVKEMMLEFFED
ncbi:hypothetical protein [Nocardia tengchongensis]|uniref:hypothetical protein n=1 Tax=Nocardia tengchongensis TaxID=2055889 RepID=UPI0036C8183D